VKIGQKLQSLGKISNIAAADPPSYFRSIPTLYSGVGTCGSHKAQ